jgi:sec-independent protein translocase protein TatA
MNTLFPELAIGMPGTMELIIIGCILLLFFGPKRLPELAKSIGGAITSFKEGLSAKPAPEEEKRVAPPAAKTAGDSGKDGAGA